MRWRVYSAAVCVVAAAAVLAANQQRPDRFALFSRYLEAFRMHRVIPGLSAAILEDGRIVWEAGFGFQDLERRIAATPDTPYRTASLTKTFASTLLMQCVERGTLNLDASISQYTTAIPESGATVRHVLTHTSAGQPGMRFTYDGNRFSALTAVVSACADRPFRQALAAEILDRAAMRDSVPGQDLEAPSAAVAALFDSASLTRYTAVLLRLAKPYATVRGRPSLTDYPDRGISAAAGLVSTVRDLAKYDKAIDDHVFIRSQTQELAWTNFTTSSGKSPYGLGWFVQSYDGRRLIWHYGSWPQFSALYLKVPERRLTLILLANSGGLSTPFPMANGDVTVSPFARLFLKAFL